MTRLAKADDLFGQAREQVASQADHGTHQLADTLVAAGRELTAMAERSEQADGPMTTVVRRVGTWATEMGERFGSGGYKALAGDLKGFARSSPGLFLLAAAGAGFAVGRVVRNVDTKAIASAARDTGSDDAQAPAAIPAGLGPVPEASRRRRSAIEGQPAPSRIPSPRPRPGRRRSDGAPPRRSVRSDDDHVQGRDRSSPGTRTVAGPVAHGHHAGSLGASAGEVELAKLELKEEATTAAKAGGMLGAAGVLGHLAAPAVFAAAWGLAAVMPTGLASHRGGDRRLVAFVVFTVGRNRMKAATPIAPQTARTLKEDVQWAKQLKN